MELRDICPGWVRTERGLFKAALEKKTCCLLPAGLDSITPLALKGCAPGAFSWHADQLYLACRAEK